MELYIPPIVVKAGNQTSVVGTYVAETNEVKLFNFELYNEKDYTLTDILIEFQFIFSDKFNVYVKELMLIEQMKVKDKWRF